MKSSFLAVFTLLFLVTDGKSEPTNNQAAVSVLGQANFTTNVFPDPPSAGTMNGPEGIAVDPTTGKVFVADSGNNRVLRFSSTAAYQSNAAAELALGQPNLIVANANNGGVLASTMSYPTCITVDSTGTLWVADYDNNRVLRFDNASAIAVEGALANGVLGQATFTTNPPNDPDAESMTVLERGMNKPAAVAVNSAGQLWVSDSGNFRVLRFDGARNLSNGAPASAVLGQNNTSIVAADLASSVRMTGPYGISIDNGDRLWVADQSSNRILRFDGASTKGDGAPADGVLGQPDFFSDINGISANSFKNPYYVTAAPNGTVWVSDYNNKRVLGFRNAVAKSTPAVTPASADIVLGQSSFTSGASSTTSSRSQNGPSQVAIGREGSVLVASYDDSRVIRYSDPVSVTSPAKLTAIRGRATVTGTSKGATIVRYQIVGQGGFKKAAGTAARWSVNVSRLKKRVTPMKAQASAFDNRKSPIRTTRLLLKK